MNTEQLIKELQKVKNKDKEVYIYFDDEIHDIDIVDLSISDRVDINIKNPTNSMERDDFFIYIQEEWENLGNSTQADEELIHICFNAMKHFTGIIEVKK